jgi:aromatase
MAAHIEDLIVIEAPLDFVWRRTNDIASWPELFTEYAKVEVLDNQGNSIRFRLTMHPDHNGMVWSWVSERTLDIDTHTTRSVRTEPGPFKYMSLFWEYVPTGDAVMLRWIQDFEMKPTAPLGDTEMADQIRRNSRTQLVHIKSVLEAEVAAAA